ncbi:MAG: hypothetical protein C0596_09070 [Marinilabiliales bacterium]|nr:MAG: hypothetical protein C0596_09070 [Marinilabiliales bacterium]
MKAYSFLAFLFIVGLFSLSVSAQNYHLVYETDVFSISLKMAAEGKDTTPYSIEKGQYHILTFKDKKAFSFQKDTILSAFDSLWTNSYDSHSYLIIDRKKTRHQWVMALYNKNVDKVYVRSFDKSDWQKTDPLSPPVIDEFTQMIFDKIAREKDTIFEWRLPEIDFYEDSKEINGYTCKKAYLHSEKRPLTIWYTEEIDFNWCFSDYRYLIPGTVVLIELEGKPTFELLSVKELDPDNLPVRKEIIKKLRRLK